MSRGLYAQIFLYRVWVYAPDVAAGLSQRSFRRTLQPSRRSRLQQHRSRSRSLSADDAHFHNTLRKRTLSTIPALPPPLSLPLLPPFSPLLSPPLLPVKLCRTQNPSTIPALPPCRRPHIVPATSIAAPSRRRPSRLPDGDAAPVCRTGTPGRRRESRRALCPSPPQRGAGAFAQSIRRGWRTSVMSQQRTVVP